MNSTYKIQFQKGLSLPEFFLLSAVTIVFELLMHKSRSVVIYSKLSVQIQR